MPTSAVAICNLALARIGNGQAISALTESSAAAVQLSAIYETTRDTVLRAFGWRFARRTVALALVANDPSTDWAYSYQLPADCLRALRLVPPGGRADCARYPFALYGSDTGMLLMADLTAPVLEYTARVTSESLFTPDFVSAFAWRLAQDAAVALSVNPAMADRAAQAYAVDLSKAQLNAQLERQADPPRESSLITARG